MTANAVDAQSAAALVNGRFGIEGPLAQGGQALSFHAYDWQTQRSCVLKFSREAQQGAAELGSEFRHLRGLQHPHIVQALDVGRVTGPLRVAGAPGDGEVDLQGRVYLALAEVKGANLLTAAPAIAALQRPRWVWQLACHLADALAYMHARHLLHGDVTPANVAVTSEAAAVLLDFGLAWQWVQGGVAKLGATGQGTMGFAAPEALAGGLGPRSDLFGLGATLYWAWCQQLPYGDGASGVARLLGGQRPTRPGQHREGLPPPFEALLLQLVAPAPKDRPADAAEVLRRLLRLGADVGWGEKISSGAAALPLAAALAPNLPSGDVLAGVFVGREAQLAVVDDTLGDLQRGRCRVSALVLHGSPGSGRRTLLNEALARARLRGLAEAHEFAVTTLANLAHEPDQLSAPKGDPAQQATNRWAQALGEADRRAQQVPLVVLVDEARAESLPQRLALLASQAPGRCLFVFIADVGLAAPNDQVAHVGLDGFSQEDVAALLASAGLPHDQSAAQPLWQACQGHPAIAALLVRQRRAGLPLSWANAEPIAAFRSQFRNLAAGAQAAIVAVWWELPTSAALQGAQTALRAGWLTANPAGALQVPAGLHRQVLWGVWDDPHQPPDAEIKALAAEACQQLAPQDPRHAEALRVMGQTTEAFAAFLRAASERWARFDTDAALWSWEQAQLTHSDAAWPQDHVLWRAQALGMVSRYDAAEAWLQAQPAPQPVSPQVEVARAELRAWLARRQGDLEGAGRWLASAEARLQSQPTARSELQPALVRLQLRRARLFVSQGRHQAALALANQCETDDEAIRLVQWETQALASAYLGQWDQAELAVHALERHAASASEEQAGRVAAVRGLLAQLQQDLALSAAAYRKASAHYERAGDEHGRANALLNLAMVLAEQGRNADSLACFQSAYQGLLRVGAAADATAAAFNAGLLFARLGDDKASEAAEQQVRQASQALNTQAANAWLATLSAARAWQRRAWPAAALAHERAASLFAANGDPMRGCLAHLAACEAWCLAHNLASAQAALQAATPVPAALDRNLAWAHARLALAAAATPASVPALALKLAETAQVDHQRQRVVDAFRSAALAAQVLQQLRKGDQARAQARLALQWLKEIYMHTPPEHHTALLQDPDAGWLAKLPADTGPAQAEAQPGLVELAQKLSHAQARLRRFVRLSKRLNSELRLPMLLETVLDTVIELTEAERGFLLLREAQGDLVVRAARNIEQTSLEGQALAFSRSIAEQVARTGAPVVTVDAAADNRFAQALSVNDLQLRSVVAVPLTVKGQVEGTIYVDNRLRQGAFTDDDVATLLEFAELAALAIGNTRLIAELKRRDRQIETLNRRLQADLEARKDEISAMRVELSESREGFALRFDYHNLIGRSPRMMEMLRLIDRISETNLPVVIQGESGTGKELVARALVANGARKAKPFVTENCAAIPETLLESTLFGYVRGAFTGADKDTRGLFAVAHEGTLFLDEVGEMSPALQGKLLRVLQEGEYRRVGGQRNERTDVRLIVATNRDLEAMVREGRFRQDLFFRLAVVRVQLPALRERSEDIPLLVRHFLQVWQGRAGIKATSISPDALARLCAYAWPGNVRELENEIGRAAAFASATITIADLSPHILGGHADQICGEPPAGDLSLKPRVERLEKGLLREALAKFNGNQTRAAEALGLSRFGLQKKLRRYGLDI